MMLRHIPNVLTLFRLGIIIPFVILLNHQHYVSAFYIYLIAGFTDGLDGGIARCYNWQSSFGSFIDPLADKLLVASSFISLACLGILPWWLVLLVFMRDLTISIGVMAWYWVVQRELDFKPTFISKVNTALQLMLVTLCLFELAFFKFSGNLINILMIFTAMTTIITYVNYVWTWGRKAYSGDSIYQ